MKNSDIEKLLLNDAACEKALKNKIEKDFRSKILKQPATENYIFDIKKVPKDKLFSKNTIFEILNLNSRTKSYINGVQAEGYLGANNSDRLKLLCGETDSFVSENVYIKFKKAKV